jgi:hypothetical protein
LPEAWESRSDGSARRDGQCAESAALPPPAVIGLWYYDLATCPVDRDPGQSRAKRACGAEPPDATRGDWPRRACFAERSPPMVVDEPEVERPSTGVGRSSFPVRAAPPALPREPGVLHVLPRPGPSARLDPLDPARSQVSTPSTRRVRRSRPPRPGASARLDPLDPARSQVSTPTGVPEPQSAYLPIPACRSRACNGGAGPSQGRGSASATREAA